MKCSSCHTFAPIDSTFWRPNSLHSVLLGSRLVEAQEWSQSALRGGPNSLLYTGLCTLDLS